MVDNNGRAVLADFGLVNFAPDQPTLLSSCMEAGTVRWMSPELLDPQKYGLPKIRPTKASDCYALGMVVYEILSGSTPFFTDNSFAILRRVLDGERPERPEKNAGNLFTDSIWDVVERCWKDQPKERASARDVLRCLGGDSGAECEAADLSDAAADDAEYVSFVSYRLILDHLPPIIGPLISHRCDFLVVQSLDGVRSRYWKVL